jgi:hypothetical protein
MDLVLDLELVPKTSWWDNARDNLGGQWDHIRKYVYEEYGYECGIEQCDWDGKIHAHEVWEYREDEELQFLKDVVSRCPRCHEVHHMGLARIKNNYTRAKERFVEFNDLDRGEAEGIITDRFKEWQRRNRIDWDLDLSFLEGYFGVQVPDKYIRRGPNA